MPIEQTDNIRIKLPIIVTPPNPKEVRKIK